MYVHACVRRACLRASTKILKGKKKAEYGQEDAKYAAMIHSLSEEQNDDDHGNSARVHADTQTVAAYFGGQQTNLRSRRGFIRTTAPWALGGPEESQASRRKYAGVCTLPTHGRGITGISAKLLYPP